MHSASRQWLLFIPYLLVQAFVKHTHTIFTSMEGNQWLQTAKCCVASQRWRAHNAMLNDCQQGGVPALGLKSAWKAVAWLITSPWKGKAPEQCAQQIRGRAPSSAGRSCRAEPAHVLCKCTLVRTHTAMHLRGPLPWESYPWAERLQSP